MSLITKDRLSVRPFAAVPALLDLPEIQREPASVSNVSSRLSSMRGRVDLEEGCLVTKFVKYAHQLAYMVNAVRSGDPEPVVSKISRDPTAGAEAFRSRRMSLIHWGSYHMMDSASTTHVTSFSVSLMVLHWRNSSDFGTVESFVHTSLDLYAFIALVPSSSVVNELIEMVKSDNDRRQREMDQRGHARRRSLNVRIHVVTISLSRVPDIFS